MTVEATVLGGLWALDWAWRTDETNLRCEGISGICMPNLSIVACIVSEISAFIRTDGQTVYSFRDLSVHPDRHGYG